MYLFMYLFIFNCESIDNHEVPESQNSKYSAEFPNHLSTLVLFLKVSVFHIQQDSVVQVTHNMS